ncbi:MAG TPA: hypothetical protein VNO30_15505 [Kofleriaceae bacterium]|nr:hypothetical protein [Kofleriaceae bacterium]
MRQSRLALACAALACSACGACGHGDGPAKPRRDDGGVAIDAAVADVAERALGLPDLAAFQWRKRGGHPAYRIARKAEAAGQWAEVVTTCRQALAADPSHLEASWLLAAALGRLGKVDQILEPLHAAVAGDFAKWGHASIDLPALAAFHDAPVGRAWARRVEQDRAAFTAALARALIVTAGGELYAYDPKGPRWHRLTHTYGAVIGGLRVPAEKRIVYVTRQRAKGKGKKDITLAAGIVDLARGRTLGAIELGTKGPISVAYAAKKLPGVWIGTYSPRGVAWQVLDDSGKLSPAPPRSVRPPGPWLAVFGRTVRPRTLPVADVVADFDDKGLASAIRIGRSSRILSIPSPALIDGNSLAWSADGAQLAFVAQLDDECGPGAPNAAVYVADATTGALRELERAASGLAVDWLSDGRPVVAGDKGVSIVDAGGPVPIEGADGLLASRVRPKCTPPDDDAAAPPPAPAEDPDQPEAAGAAGDAGGAAGAAGTAGAAGAAAGSASSAAGGAAAGAAAGAAGGGAAAPAPAPAVAPAAPSQK